jgi:hypothetical protein
MKYFNYILVGVGLLLSSFAKGNTSKVIKAPSFYNDISPNEEWVLYRTPDDLDSGELHTGTLNAVHITSGQIVNVDNFFMEWPSTFFFNDNMVAVPTDGEVQLYDLAKKKFIPEPLVTYPEAYSLLQFSLSEDKSKVAVLLLDFDNHIDYIKENQGYARVELRIIDLKSKQEYQIDHYTYRSDESKYRIGDILWHGDQVVYSFQSELYYYELGNPKRIFFTNRMEKYAIDGDEVVYITAGYGKNKRERNQEHCKIFSFKNLKVRDVTVEEEKNLRIITESPDYPSYVIRLENGEFRDQEGLVIYRGKKVVVKYVGADLVITKL